jgi:hypothetical protein
MTTLFLLFMSPPITIINVKMKFTMKSRSQFSRTGGAPII